MASGAGKPNLIFLFADQLRYQSCGFAGDSRAQTPNLDRLATQGCDFANATSVYPLCGPYRASLLTGKFPTSTGMYRNDVRCMPDEHAIGHVLAQAGYRTAYIGKWHLYCRNGSEQHTPPGPYRLGFDDYWASYNWNHEYWNGFYYRDTDERIPMQGFEEDFQTDLALDYLADRDPSKPFALFLSYEVPHPPLTRENCTPEEYEAFDGVDFSDLLYSPGEIFDKFTPSFSPEWHRKEVIDAHNERCRVYYALAARLDRNIGRLMAYLDAHQLAEDTILVFTSDHGEMLGAHGRNQKRAFFEESVRVPFLMRWSGHIAPAVAAGSYLNTPDILPTLLDLMGIPIPAGVEGYSYARTALGQEQADAPAYAFLMCMMEGKFNHHEEWRAVRDGQFLYARMQRTGKELLFHHAVDPRELVNLADDVGWSEKLQHYRSVLERELGNRHDDFRSSGWYDENWIEDGCVVRSATRELETGRG